MTERSLVSLPNVKYVIFANFSGSLPWIKPTANKLNCQSFATRPVDRVPPVSRQGKDILNGHEPRNGRLILFAIMRCMFLA